MNRHERQAHTDLVATARGLTARNVPALPMRKPEPKRYALACFAAVATLALAMFRSL